MKKDFHKILAYYILEIPFHMAYGEDKLTCKGAVAQSWNETDKKIIMKSNSRVGS